MIHLELTDNEAEALRDVLAIRHRELLLEIAHADRHAARDELRLAAVELEALLGKLTSADLHA